MVRLVAIAPAGGRSDLIPSPVSLTGRGDSALVRFIALLPRSSITGVVDANIVVLRKRMRRSSFFKNAHICFWICFWNPPQAGCEQAVRRCNAPALPNENHSFS